MDFATSSAVPDQPIEITTIERLGAQGNEI